MVGRAGATRTLNRRFWRPVRCQLRHCPSSCCNSRGYPVSRGVHSHHGRCTASQCTACTRAGLTGSDPYYPPAVWATRVSRVNQRDLRKLPKAHLHLHCTGSMRPETLRELAEEQGRRLPESLRQATATPDSLRLPATKRGWFRFQQLYDAARALVRDEAAMRR